MNEILFERSEFLVLLDTIDANVIVGITRKDLFPQHEEEHKTVLKQGITLLKQRGMLDEDNRPHINLLRLAKIIAYPQLVFFMVRNVTSLGPQIFLLYQSQDGIVEQTFPTEGVHRLAVIPDTSFLLNRALHILSLPEQPLAQSVVNIAQEAFFQCYRLMQQNQRKPALDFLQRANMPTSEAKRLLIALQSPAFLGEVALLKCIHQTIVDARDIAIIQDQHTAWYATQIVPGELRLHAASADIPTLRSLLSRYLMELTSTDGNIV
jgi:hypothetical protein